MKRLSLKLIIFVFLIVAIGIFGIKALLHQGYYTSHDGWHQVARLYYYNQAVRDGVFPPTYIKDLFYGYGYPLFIFSYHLPWLIAEPFMLLGLSVFDSIKIVYIITYIVSGLTMFAWLKRRFSLFEAFIGSLLYLWAPYRFSNIFVRGAIGEATIFVFLPLLFLAIDMAREKLKWVTIFIGAIAISGIMLSHAIVALLISGFSSLYILILFLFNKNRKIFIINLTVLLIFGLSLCSYYLIPSINLKQYTQFDQKIQSTKFDGQFATIKELLYSKWGYGFSAPRQSDSMSFQIGVAQWLLIALLILKISSSFIRKNNLTQIDFLLGLLIIFFISILLILPSASNFWDFVSKRVFFIDFPWRLLTLIVFSSSALAAYLLHLLKHKLKFVVSILLIIIALYTNRNHLRVNQYTNIPLSLYLSSEDTTNTYDEYLPKIARSDQAESSKNGGKIENDKNIIIDSQVSTVNSISFKYSSDQLSDFKINLFYFPGWEVYIDNYQEDLKYTDEGLIQFQGPGGHHAVVIKYSGTQLMKTARLLSFLTLIILIGGFFLPYRKFKPLFNKKFRKLN